MYEWLFELAGQEIVCDCNPYIHQEMSVIR